MAAPISWLCCRGHLYTRAHCITPRPKYSVVVVKVPESLGCAAQQAFCPEHQTSARNSVMPFSCGPFPDFRGDIRNSDAARRKPTLALYPPAYMGGGSALRLVQLLQALMMPDEVLTTYACSRPDSDVHQVHILLLRPLSKFCSAGPVPSNCSTAVAQRSGHSVINRQGASHVTPVLQAPTQSRHIPLAVSEKVICTWLCSPTP